MEERDAGHGDVMWRAEFPKMVPHDSTRPTTLAERLATREAPFDHHEKGESHGTALDIVLVTLCNLNWKATDGQSRIL